MTGSCCSCLLCRVVLPVSWFFEGMNKRKKEKKKESKGPEQSQKETSRA